MSNILHRTEGGAAVQNSTTLLLHPRRLEPDRRARVHSPPASYPHVATPTAGVACMNSQQQAPVIKPCSKPRRVTVSYANTHKPRVSVPFLRLRGRWLQDAGFIIGRHVKVEVSEGRMTIEQVD